MKLPTPKWLKPKDAPLPDLQAQLDAAKADLEEAKAAESAAHATYLASGTPEADAADEAAKQRRERAEKQVARAEQCIADAEAKRSAQEHRELQANYNALAAELSAPDAIDAGLVEREAQAYLAAIEVRAERHAHFARRAAKRHELGMMGYRLGHAPATRFDSETPHPHAVARVIHEHVSRLPAGPIRDLTYALANFLAPNFGMFR